MKNALKMLKVVWPNGIPAQDYRRALDVIGAAQEKKAAKKDRMKPATKTNEEKVRAALATGPATAREVAEVTGLSVPATKYVLDRIATASGSRPNPGGFGLAANVYTLTKGA